MSPLRLIAALFVLLCPGRGMADEALARAQDEDCAPAAQREKPLVVLDVGHSLHSAGAASPDKRVQECFFWYRNVGYMVQELEKNGVSAVVCNRSRKPTKEPFASIAKICPLSIWMPRIQARDTLPVTTPSISVPVWSVWIMLSR